VATMGSTVSTIQDQVKTFKTFKDVYEKDHVDMKESIEKIQVHVLSFFKTNVSCGFSLKNYFIQF
jgi:hypothetical protein